MNQAEIVNQHNDLYKRFEAVGLTLKTSQKEFVLNDAPGSNGSIRFSDLNEAERFIRGYELGYKAGL